MCNPIPSIHHHSYRLCHKANSTKNSLSTHTRRKCCGRIRLKRKSTDSAHQVKNIPYAKPSDIYPIPRFSSLMDAKSSDIFHLWHLQTRIRTHELWALALALISILIHSTGPDHTEIWTDEMSTRTRTHFNTTGPDHTRDLCFFFFFFFRTPYAG